MWIIGNSSGRRTISTGCEVIVAKCSVPASEQLDSGNCSSATVLDLWNMLPEMVVTGCACGYCADVLIRIWEDSAIWEIKARQLLIPSSARLPTERYWLQPAGRASAVRPTPTCDLSSCRRPITTAPCARPMPYMRAECKQEVSFRIVSDGGNNEHRII